MARLTTSSEGPAAGGAYCESGRVLYFVDSAALSSGRVLIHEVNEDELRQLVVLARSRSSPARS